MTRRVEWTERAVGDLEKLDRPTRERIRAAVYRLAREQRGDMRPLRGYEDTWRLRVGPWRVLFTPNAAADPLRILRVLPRSGAYRP